MSLQSKTRVLACIPDIQSSETTPLLKSVKPDTTSFGSVFYLPFLTRSSAFVCQSTSDKPSPGRDDSHELVDRDSLSLYPGSSKILWHHIRSMGGK